MPSYNLIRNINLGDVHDTELARKTLDIGPLDTQHSNDVYFTGGSIVCERMAIVPVNPLIPNVSYVIATNDGGRFGWSTDNGIDPWASYETIYLSNFNQDVAFTTHGTLHPVASSASFNSLINIPTTTEIIPAYEYPHLLNFNSNLEDLVDVDRATIKLSLGIGNIAYEPDEFVMLEDISVSNLFIFGDEQDIGSLLISGDTVIKEGYLTNTTYWYNPFFDEHNNPRDHLTLGNSYKEKSDTHSVTCRTLKRMYDDMLYYINKKQHNLDMDRVRESISNMVVTGHFLVTDSNLGDDGLDPGACRSNLNIGSISEFDSNNVVVENISINSNLIFESVLNASFSSDDDDVYITCQDTDGSLGMITLSNACTHEYGYARYCADIDYTSIGDNDVITWNYIAELRNNILNDIDHVEHVDFLFDFDDYVYDTRTFVDCNLSQFNGLDLSEVYKNLHLCKIATSGEYTDLHKYPNSIHAYINDIPILERAKNCTGFPDTNEAKTNLGVGSIASQNHTNVTITGGGATLRVVESYGGLFVTTYPYEIVDKWLAYDHTTNSVTYTDLPHASHQDYGVVKKVNVYDTAGYDTTVTMSALADMYNVLDAQLDLLEARIKHSFSN
jgi:hypothetical protein